VVNTFACYGSPKLADAFGRASSNLVVVVVSSFVRYILTQFPMFFSKKKLAAVVKL
jgi:hypothetical protein